MSNVSTQPRILVVDDSRANLLAMGAVLKPLGVKVVEALSGAAAIEHIANETFAVALLDVQMPEMDGFEVARRVRLLPTGAELPIIFLTAIHRDELFAKQGYATGAADYITKPFDADILRARVKAFVDLFHQLERMRFEQVGLRTRERDDALEKLSQLLERERAARLEAELANKAKDEFLATMSHELRTPLNAILGWAVLARDMATDPPLQRALGTIERNARSQMRIIEDVLDIGRIINGKLRLEIAPTVVADAISGAVEAVAPAAAVKDIELDVKIAANVGVMQADADRLQQIMWNVLSNAIKFTPRGGHVSVAATRAASTLCIRVCDDGHGIDAAFVPFLFDAFKQADGTTTRRHGGVGLGLAIVKQLVQAHGGKIVATSDGPGRGAQFTIELPVRERTPLIVHEAPARPRHDHKLDGITVLVVDDDEDARMLLRHVLESCDAKVVLAPGAAEALERVKTGDVDLIISDISMPDVDGCALMRHIRALPNERARTTPAIALTAHTSHDFTDAAIDAGFQACLAKPVDIDAVIAVAHREKNRATLVRHLP